jgi:hypothetical protein
MKNLKRNEEPKKRQAAEYRPTDFNSSCAKHRKEMKPKNTNHRLYTTGGIKL